jgi:hypothetical protein
MQRSPRLATHTAAFALLCIGSATAQESAAELTESPEPSTALTAIDVRASQFASSTKDSVAIDTDAHGRTVAVWQSRRQQSGSYGIYARRFDADGTPLGDEVQVNLTTRGHQMNPSVALDADGSAWFVWNSVGQDGDSGGIFARRFDATLQSSTNEILVNAERAGDQDQPTIDSDDQGNAVVLWEDQYTADSATRIRGRRLSPSGDAQGAAFDVESNVTGSCRQASLSIAQDAGFVVAWARTDVDGVPAGIWARQFDSETQGGGEWLLSAGGAENSDTSNKGSAIEPVVSSIDDTHFVATWLEGVGGEYNLVHRSVSLDSDALTLGPLKREAAPESGYVSGATVAARADGAYALAWNHYQPGESRADLFLATFDKNGNALRTPFMAHGSSEGNQHLAAADGSRSLVFTDAGGLVVGWSGDGGFGDRKAAHVSIHAGESQVLVAAEQSTVPSKHIAEPAKPHEPPTYSPPQGVQSVDHSAVLHAVTGGVGFNGIASSGWTPPDPEIAVGPNHLVMMTNGEIAFFNKSGALLFSDEIENSFGFWGAQGADNFVFDPECRYDPHSNRFFAMACERADNGKPYFLLAVSDDSDPMGTWHKYRMDVQVAAGGDTDIDSPNMGIDAQAVYLTADFFGPDKFLVFIVDKSSILNGGNPSTTSTLITGKQSMGLPLMYGSSPRQYMVWAPEFSGGNSIEIFAINNPLTNPSVVSTVLNVPSYNQPENPPQQGTSTRPETFEARFWSACYNGGSLWATHHTGNNRVLQRWYEIDMANWPVSGSPSLVQSGDIDPGPGIRTYFGSIAADAAGNMAMTFARSSSSEFISMGFTTRAAGDALGTTEPMIIAKSSTGADTTGRWGDYSGVAPDPAGGGQFWAAHEYRQGGWRTWIQSMVSKGGPANYCVTSPNSVGAGSLISSTGSASVGANDLVLHATAAPSSVSGLFFFGFAETQSPFGNGQLCVAGAIQRLPVSSTNGSGDAAHNLDITSMQVGGTITPGTTAKFQYWYRDPGVGAGFNLTDGLSVDFVP